MGVTTPLDGLPPFSSGLACGPTGPSPALVVAWHAFFKALPGEFAFFNSLPGGFFKPKVFSNLKLQVFFKPERVFQRPATTTGPMNLTAGPRKCFVNAVLPMLCYLWVSMFAIYWCYCTSAVSVGAVSCMSQISFRGHRRFMQQLTTHAADKLLLLPAVFYTIINPNYIHSFS